MPLIYHYLYQILSDLKVCTDIYGVNCLSILIAAQQVRKIYVRLTSKKDALRL
jgi:hypothetical protein